MSSAHHYSPAWLSAKFFVSASFALTLLLSFAPSQSAAENSGDLASKAMAILEQNCGNSG